MDARYDDALSGATNRATFFVRLAVKNASSDALASNGVRLSYAVVVVGAGLRKCGYE